jgi:hypothetical protein
MKNVKTRLINMLCYSLMIIGLAGALYCLTGTLKGCEEQKRASSLKNHHEKMQEEMVNPLTQSFHKKAQFKAEEKESEVIFYALTYSMVALLFLIILLIGIKYLR